MKNAFEPLSTDFANMVSWIFQTQKSLTTSKPTRRNCVAPEESFKKTTTEMNWFWPVSPERSALQNAPTAQWKKKYLHSFTH